MLGGSQEQRMGTVRLTSCHFSRALVWTKRLYKPVELQTLPQSGAATATTAIAALPTFFDIWMSAVACSGAPGNVFVK